MKIESNVPVPRKYPFEHMKVGDSFLIPDGMARTTVSVAAGRYAAKHKMKFTVRQTPQGFRCWRIQ